MARNEPAATTPRSRRNARVTLVGAGRKLTYKRDEVRAEARRHQAWQDEAWDYFDDVGEVKMAVWFAGNTMSKLRLFAACYPPGGDPTASPISVFDEGSGIDVGLGLRAQAEIDRLTSSVGGQPEILREATMNFDIAGECYLVGFGEREETTRDENGDEQVVVYPEDWSIRSISEVTEKDGTYAVTGGTSGAAMRILDEERDTIIRLWQRHPRWSDRADSNLRGVLNDCETLILLTNQMKAEAKSRQNGGILTVPNELSFGAPDPTSSDEDDEAAADPFAEALLSAVSEPIEDPSAAASVMPILLRGPGEHLTPDRVRLVSLARDNTDVLEPRITGRVQRIARGLNLPFEVVMGHQETTFANAAQIDEDKFDDHFQPRCVLLVDALTVGFLHPQLIDASVDPAMAQQVFVWFDPVDIIKAKDPADSADEGHTRFLVSDESWRRVKGWTEDDAPDVDEVLIRVAMQRGIVSPGMTKALIELLGVDIEVDSLPAADDTAGQMRLLASLLRRHNEQPAAALAAAADPENIGATLTAIDRELRSRLLVAADRAVKRALERAGNRLKSQASVKQVLRGTSPFYAAATLGPTRVRDAGYDTDLAMLDADRWADLAVQFDRWVGRAQDDALRVMSRWLGDVSPVEAEAIALKHANDRAEAWAWFAAELDRLAVRLLYAPDPIVAAGEQDPTLSVPTGLARGALARAGGGSGLETVGGDAMYVTVAAGDRPAGGVATGETIMGLASEHGASAEAYRWVYGPAFRQHPFEEHVALDGVVFADFDAEGLGNDLDWMPFGTYFPGDHAGCACDFEPFLVRGGADDADANDVFANDSTFLQYFADEETITWADHDLEAVLRSVPLVDDAAWVAQGGIERETIRSFLQEWSDLDTDASELGQAAVDYMRGVQLTGHDREAGEILARLMDNGIEYKDGSMYRGAVFADDVGVGDRLAMNPSSFSRKLSHAESYQESAGAWTGDILDTGDPSKVLFDVVNPRGVPVEALSSFGAHEQEWIIGGNFEVLGVEQTDIGRRVTLRMVE